MNPGRSSPGDAGRAPLPWGRIALWFAASRAMILVLGWASTYIVTEGPFDRWQNWSTVLVHWDANWYLRIAREGYQRTQEGLVSPNFFPLYPLLIRAMHLVIPDLRVAAYAVSYASTFGASVLLWKLARRDEERADAADRAVLFFLFNPVSVFYSSAYSEGLFLLLLLGLAWFATEQQWLRAGACGYLLSLSRPVGVLAVALLAAEFFAPYVASRRDRENGPRWPHPQALAFLTSLALTAGGLATYSAWQAVHFGDPIAFLHATEHWHHYLATPWFTFFDPKFGMFYRRWLQGAVIVALALFALGFAVRLRPSYLVMTGVFLLVYLSTAHLESVPRYFSVLFPFYIVAARVSGRWRGLAPVLFAGSAMLLAVSTILFVNGYWFT